MSINGPTTLASGQVGRWTASTPDPTAGYQYNWQSKITFTGCGARPAPSASPEIEMPSIDESAITGPTPQRLPPCNIWMDGYGSGAVYTYSTGSSLTLELRVTASWQGGSMTSPVWRVCVAGCSSGGGGPYDPLTAGESGEAAAALGAEGKQSPATLALESVSPNPLRAGNDAAVTFTLTEAGPAMLRVFDVLGREVARPADGPMEAGRHTARLTSSGLTAGTYLVRLEAGGSVLTRRFTILQ